MTTEHAVWATVASIVAVPSILGNSLRAAEKAEGQGENGKALFRLLWALPESATVLIALWAFA